MEAATKTPLPNLGFVSIFQFLLQLTPNILLFSLIAIYSLRITHIKGEENKTDEDYSFINISLHVLSVHFDKVL